MVLQGEMCDSGHSVSEAEIAEKTLTESVIVSISVMVAHTTRVNGQDSHESWRVPTGPGNRRRYDPTGMGE